MSESNRHPDATPPAPDRDAEMDALLREWHHHNAARAAAGREVLLARLRAGEHAPNTAANFPPLIDDEMEESLRAARTPAPPSGPMVILRRIAMHPTWSAAAAALILAALLPLLMINRGGNFPAPTGGPVAPQAGPAITRASFEGYLLCPEGGRLDARSPDGDLLGPCELKHTDVVVDVSGFLTRVTLTQKYHNPHPDKIEAVYTFPLSERAAVDRMIMTIGNRVIEGQVKERAEARRIYEEARAQGRIASLLEQERPNIFTQSIANIEPGASIDITISYVETTRQTDGVFEFDFPTTIGPRFIPGNPVTSETLAAMPPNIQTRRGLVLLAPATISDLHAGDSSRGALSEADLSRMLRAAVPIRPVTPSSTIWYSFRAAYADGSAELGTLFTDGVGTLNGRWFCIPHHALTPAPQTPTGANEPGAPFAPSTDRVPDAAKITPMPQTPGTRAGHDISITVNIDTGGPALGLVKSELHQVVTSKTGSRATVKLANNSDIPNRDFVLKWAQESREIEPALFTYSGPQGNFFAVQITPPPAPAGARAADDDDFTLAVPREMIFVLDVSGSMKGRPIEKAKEVLDKSLSALRPADTFNIIKFQNSLETLWAAARPATAENLAEARAFYNQQIGGGGTQMLQAIQEAFAQVGRHSAPSPELPPGLQALQLANLPADGRRVVVTTAPGELRRPAKPDAHWSLLCGNGVELDVRAETPMPAATDLPSLRLAGRWETTNGRRIFVIDSVTPINPNPKHPPHRSSFIVFLTDGLIGNDNEVLAEIQANRSRAAVFPFAIGNSPNRYLLDSMARVGRGEVEYVYDSTNADDTVARFAQRIHTPILTNIDVEFSPSINVLDVMTALGGGGGGGSVSTIDAIPDLFDVKPLTIVGRYNQPAHGVVTITGNTAAGPYRRSINIDLPAPRPAEVRAPEAPATSHRADTIATLWARAKVESLTFQDLRGVLANNINPTLRADIVSLGKSFSLVTPYTSFVAVDRLRMTIAGQPRLVHIPIELPAGTDFTGFFGAAGTDEDDIALLGDQWTDAEGLGLSDARFFGTRGLVTRTAGQQADNFGLGGQPAADTALPKLRETAGLAPPSSPAPTAAPGRAPADLASASRGRSQPGRESSAPAASEPAAPPPPPAPAAAPAPRPAIEAAQSERVIITRPAERERRQIDDREAAERGLSLLRDESLGRGDTPDVGLILSLPEPDASVAESERWDFTQSDSTRNAHVDRVLSLYSAVSTPTSDREKAAAPDQPAPRPRVILAEQVIARIGELARAGDLEKAAELANALADALPDLATAADLHRVLSDPAVTADERTRVFDEHVKSANDRLDAMRREATLRRRLAPDLLSLVHATPESPAPAPDLLVTILVENTDEPTRAALTNAGLRIESFDAPTKVIVGTTTPATLADIALTEHVRRVELTK